MAADPVGDDFFEDKCFFGDTLYDGMLFEPHEIAPTAKPFEEPGC